MSDPISNLPTYSSTLDANYAFVPVIVQDSYAGTPSGYKNVKVPVGLLAPQSSESIPLVMRIFTSGFTSNSQSSGLDGTVLMASPDAEWDSGNEKIKFNRHGLYRVTLSWNTKPFAGNPWPAQHSQHVVNIENLYCDPYPGGLTDVVESRYETTVGNVTQNAPQSGTMDFMVQVLNHTLDFNGFIRPHAAVYHSTSESPSRTFGTEFAVTVKYITDVDEPS